MDVRGFYSLQKCTRWLNLGENNIPIACLVQTHMCTCNLKIDSHLSHASQQSPWAKSSRTVCVWIGILSNRLLRTFWVQVLVMGNSNILPHQIVIITGIASAHSKTCYSRVTKESWITLFTVQFIYKLSLNKNLVRDLGILRPQKWLFFWVADIYRQCNWSKAKDIMVLHLSWHPFVFLFQNLTITFFLNCSYSKNPR